MGILSWSSYKFLKRRNQFSINQLIMKRDSEQEITVKHKNNNKSSSDNYFKLLRNGGFWMS